MPVTHENYVALIGFKHETVCSLRLCVTLAVKNIHILFNFKTEGITFEIPDNVQWEIPMSIQSLLETKFLCSLDLSHDLA